jgi:hypothetical protein
MTWTFLERSGQALLTVHVVMRDDPGSDELQCERPPDACTVSDAFWILHRHSSRISTLTISGSEVDWDDLEEKMIRFNTRFPNLRNLDVSVDDRDGDFDTGIMTLRALIQRQTTPIQLTKLKVTTCMPDLLAIDFSCMTSLHLTCWAPLEVGQAQWRELLMSARRLKTLFIGNVTGMPVLEQGALIHFLHLRTIQLYGPIQAYTRLLNHICVPEDTTIIAKRLWTTSEPISRLVTVKEMFAPFLLRHFAKMHASSFGTYLTPRAELIASVCAPPAMDILRSVSWILASNLAY